MNTTRTNRTPGTTYTAAVADSVHELDRAKLHLNGMRAVYARINIGGNDAREAFGTDPAQGGLGHPLTAGTLRELHGFQEISAWRVINDVGAANTDLTITIFYA